MERLADIVDQVPESKEEDAEQIALPPIQGRVKFESLQFRFSNSGQYQINNVNLEIEQGNFIGIVGQSGSGKSTLMKLPKTLILNRGEYLLMIMIFRK